MEKAKDIAEKEDNRTLKIWSYSNLVILWSRWQNPRII
jgi:hypothetical protein